MAARYVFSDPLQDLGEPEFVMLHRSYDELVCDSGLGIEVGTVSAQENIGGRGNAPGATDETLTNPTSANTGQKWGTQASRQERFRRRKTSAAGEATRLVPLMKP